MPRPAATPVREPPLRGAGRRSQFAAFAAVLTTSINRGSRKWLSRYSTGSFFNIAAIASATTVIPPNFDELVSRAEVIFEGEVTGVQSQWIGEGAEHRIVTFVTLVTLARRAFREERATSPCVTPFRHPVFQERRGM